MSCTSSVPTRYETAIPTWFALSAMVVASVRSSGPNQLAASSAGVHWKKGCAAPTSTVPTITNA